jgi:hypothetical protein
MFAMRKKFVKFQGSFWPSQISMLAERLEFLVTFETGIFGTSEC